MDKYEWLLVGLAIGVPIGIAIIVLARQPTAATAQASNIRVRSYVNEEEWAIIRDERGLAIGVKAIRHAKEA